MTDAAGPGFQRARSAEQRELRKESILEAATQLLDEAPLGDISLRELSRRVGLSKTNVVRYFETREAVFFELLNRALAEWIQDLSAELAERPQASGEDVVGLVAQTLADRRVLCELISALGSELERNLSVDTVREFKIAHTRSLGELADVLVQYVDGLDKAEARELVSLTIVYTAGLWPFAHPSAAVEAAQEDPRLAETRVDFPARLTRTLTLALSGMLHKG